MRVAERVEINGISCNKSDRLLMSGVFAEHIRKSIDCKQAVAHDILLEIEKCSRETIIVNFSKEVEYEQRGKNRADYNSGVDGYLRIRGGLESVSLPRGRAGFGGGRQGRGKVGRARTGRKKKHRAWRTKRKTRNSRPANPG